MNLESLWDDVWTTLGLHFQHLILDYCKSGQGATSEFARRTPIMLLVIL